MILKTSEDIKVKSGLLKISMLTVWTAMMPGLASCVQEAVVYDDAVAEIGFSPVAGMATKALPGAVDGPDDSDFDYETIGIFAYHKITDESQPWEEFYNASGAGSLVTYIDGKPFAKNSSSKYWAGGYNDLSISVDRVEDEATGKKKRETVTTVEAASNVHAPHYWPKTGYLAFAGYSPYYRLEISKVPGEDGNMDLKYDTSATRLSSGDCKVSYEPDGNAPHLKIENFTQGDYEWGEDDHWATNETCDLMWFDVNDQNTANSLTTPGIGVSESAVPVKFNHACAWIDFRFRAADEVANEKFVMLKATLGDMFWKGDFVSDDGTGSPEWTGLEDKRDIVLFYNLGDGNADRTNKFNYITYEDCLQAGGMMIIPQLINKTEAGGGTQTSTLTIYYKQLTSDTEYEPAHEIYVEDQDEVVDEEATLNSGTPLTEVFTYSFDGQARWEMGKHYVYDIVFGLNEIRVSPSVTEWDDVQTSVPLQ